MGRTEKNSKRERRRERKGIGRMDWKEREARGVEKDDEGWRREGKAKNRESCIGILRMNKIINTVGGRGK